MTEQARYTVVLVVVIGVTIMGVVFSPREWPTTVGLGALVSTSVLILRAAALAAVKVDLVRFKQIETDHRMERIEKVGDDTHTLVNSSYGASLKATLIALENVLLLTVQFIPENKAKAESDVDQARSAYDDHMAQQRIVDAGEKLV